MAIKWTLTSLKLYVLCGFHNVMNSEDIYHTETSSPNLQLTLGWEKLITSIENIQRPKQGIKWNIGHVCTIILRSRFQNSVKNQEISTTWNITSPSEVLGTSKALKEKRRLYLTLILIIQVPFFGAKLESRYFLMRVRSQLGSKR